MSAAHHAHAELRGAENRLYIEAGLSVTFCSSSAAGWGLMLGELKQSPPSGDLSSVDIIIMV